MKLPPKLLLDSLPSVKPLMEMPKDSKTNVVYIDASTGEVVKEFNKEIT